MPKIKTKKGALKRFKRTGAGGLLRHKAFASHIMSKKSTKRKKKPEEINPPQQGRHKKGSPTGSLHIMPFCNYSRSQTEGF